MVGGITSGTRRAVEEEKVGGRREHAAGPGNMAVATHNRDACHVLFVPHYRAAVCFRFGVSVSAGRRLMLLHSMRMREGAMNPFGGIGDDGEDFLAVNLNDTIITQISSTSA